MKTRKVTGIELEEYARRLEHFRQRMEEEVDPDRIEITEMLITVVVEDMDVEDPERLKRIGKEFLEGTGLQLTFSWELESD